ncbi:hypothetical protein AB0K00_21690 [Dactylosporangium sp. NPDC049525]|uniref:hypothetical protein n=1 Tax=Dactylosporangium sp. NPDC049525 TaxID=3154730 RepID=UPI00342E710E
MQALRDEVVDRIGAAFVERGWQLWDEAGRETPTLTLSRPNDVIHSIALTSLPLSFGGVRFSPSLEVAHVDVSRLAAAFAGRSWSGAGDTSLFGTTLATLVRAGGDLKQSAVGWTIESRSDVEPAVDAMFGNIKIHGMAYLNRFRDLEDLISWMRADKGYQILVGNLAVALAVSGASEEAAQTLHDYVAFVARMPPGVLRDRTRSFVEAFAAHFGYGADAAGPAA